MKAALRGVDADSARAGKSMGDRMSGALGKALKTGAAAAGAAGVAAIGTTMVKGFQRLQAIDDAKGKLEGLGHTAGSTQKIMDSALQSVKGTAYGLGDAATIAASAVAAGVKPGQQLTKYLSSIGDAASIAGTSLGEMGLIFNQVQTGGRAMTDDLNQMAQRGIPIFQWLGEEMGVAASEVKDLASKGKISSEVFFQAVEKNIGGAALSAGKTVRGSFQNMIASMGRLGAAAQQPFFARLPGVFTSATTAIDSLTPRVAELAAQFDHKVFEEWGPKVRAAMEAARDSGALDDLRIAIHGVWSAAERLGPSVGRIFAELGRASQALGVGTWELFLAALNAAAGVLDLVNPLLSTTADLMEDNRTVVTALLAAWLAFKTVPSILGMVSSAITPMQAGLKAAKDGALEFGGAWRQSMTWMQQSNPGMSRARAGLSVLGAQGASVMGGLKTGAMGVVNAFGGPLTMALTGAAVVGGAWVASAQRQKSITEEYERATSALAKSQRDLGVALIASGGQMDERAMSAAVESVDRYRASVDAAAKADAKWHNVAQDVVFDKVLGLGDGTSKQMDEAAKKAQMARAALEDLGLTSEQVAARVHGSRSQYESLRSSLLSMGEGGVAAAQDLAEMRASFEQQQTVAARLTPGFSELSAAVRVLGDDSASSSSKLDALRVAMDALSPTRSKAQALAQYGETLRRTADAAGGIDGSAFSGAVFDPMSESGKRLSEVLGELADKSAQVVATGGDIGVIGAENEKVFEQLAAATGRSVDEIRDLYGEMGGTVVDLAIEVQGSNEVQAQLATIRTMLDEQPDEKEITLTTSEISGETLAMLDRLGVGWEGDEHTVTIDARDESRAIIEQVLASVKEVDGAEAAPTISLDISKFSESERTAVQKLRDLDSTRADPEATLAIDNLLSNKELSVAELALLDRMLSEPSANLEDSELRRKIQEMNAALDAMARPRTTTLTLRVDERIAAGMPMFPGSDEINAGGYAVPPRADGAVVRAYMNGGIADAESFANGGLRVIDKPMRADIFAGRGAGTIFAEEETGGEAYVPLARSKRRRSTDILATVADMFGLALVPKDSISGMLGAAVGNVVTRALRSTVGAGIARFVDGGITASSLKDHMRGIDGATYVRGGWGQGWKTDCSGGQSIAANATEGNLQAGTGERSATGGFPVWLPKMGYTLGQAPSGVPAHEVGWSSEHASGTIFDPVGGDVNVEMGGQNGGGAFGRGAVSSRDGQFPNQAWKPLADPDYLTAGGYGAEPGIEPGGEAGTASTARGYGVPDQSPTLSGRLGGAAGAFVSGQLQSLFGVLGINDSPGALAALSEYERQRQQKEGDPSTREAIEKGADPKKLQAAENKIADKEGQLRAAEQRLREVEADPKAKESAKLTARARVEKLERELEQARKDLEALKRQQKSTPVTPLPEGDPGVPAGDVKSIVRRALQSRGWHEGDQWSATDWIANKDSTWNPKARNGKYTGLFQLGPDAWKAAGIDPTDDPAKQAEAYAHYVDGRYKLPTAAKAFHEQNNWYDRGGIAKDVGLMLKNTNRPERVLSPRQTTSFEEMVKRDFQSGIGTDQVIAELRVIRELLAERDRGDIHNHFESTGSAKRDAEEVSRDQRQRALLGGL